MHYGGSLDSEISLEIDQVLEEISEMSPSKKGSPLRKLKQLFKSNSKEYQIQPGMEIAYVDLPREIHKQCGIGGQNMVKMLNGSRMVKNYWFKNWSENGQKTSTWFMNAPLEFR